MRYIFSVRALGLFSGQSRSEVEFRFNPTGEAECSLELTICIIFPNKLRHLLARLFFTQAILRRHTKEEMADSKKWPPSLNWSNLGTLHRKLGTIAYTAAPSDAVMKLL